MMTKMPIAIVEFEGDYYRPWVPLADRRASVEARRAASLEGSALPPLIANPSQVHAIIFDDGTAFDTVNGWRGDDEETKADRLRRVEKAVRGQRKDIDQ